MKSRNDIPAESSMESAGVAESARTDIKEAIAPSITIRVANKAEAAKWLNSLHQSGPSMALGVLLSGDRWTCVDEVVLATIGDQTAGITTLAPNGEEMSGEPTIVALYVVHQHRGKGLSKTLLEAAIDRMTERGLGPIRVDVMNSKILKTIASLPKEKQAKLRVHDSSADGALDRMMEM